MHERAPKDVAFKTGAAGPNSEINTPSPELTPDPEKPFAGKRIMITGGSRDFGAALVIQLAKMGAETIVAGYSGGKNKELNLVPVMEAVKDTGVNIEFVAGDITTPEGRKKLQESMHSQTADSDNPGKFDILILNAASADDKLNVDANTEIIDQSLPFMRSGGKVVLPQSHPGHFNHVLSDANLVPDVYTGVAASKEKAEAVIKAKAPEMQAQGVGLQILVLPALPETQNVRIFVGAAKRADRNLPEEERGKQPTFQKIAQALGLPEQFTNEEAARLSAEVIAKDTGAVHTELFTDAKSGWDVLPKVYGPSALYADVVTNASVGTMIVTEDRANRRDELVIEKDSATLNSHTSSTTITPKHAEGHFEPPILAGHKQVRMAFAALDHIAGVNRVFNDKVPLQNIPYSASRLAGFESVSFEGVIKPGHTVDVKTENVIRRGNSFTGDVELSVDGLIKTRVVGMEVVATETQPTESSLFPDQIIEFAAQSAALETLSQPDKYPLFGGIGRTRFTGHEVGVGSRLLAIQTEVDMQRRRFSASSRVVDAEGNEIAKINDMRGLIGSERLIRGAIDLQS